MRYVSRLTGLGLGVQLRPEAPAFGATLIMAVALLAMRRPLEMSLSPWIAITAFGAAGAGVYLAALALIGRADLLSLVGLFKNIRDVFGRGLRSEQDEPDDGLAEAAD